MSRILIVDSSVQNTDLISKCLDIDGYELITAESGLNALAKIEIFKPDLVILDVDLLDISGYDVCKKIRQKPENKYIVILMVSSSDTKESRIRALEVLADDFIEKTFDCQVLISKVKSLLRVKYLSKQLKMKYDELEEKNNILEFQLKMAQHVQRALTPNVDFKFHDSRFISKYLPALDIGGDFYDIITEIHKDCIVVVMGDVSGHGISAALLTAMLSMMIRNLAIKYKEPEELLFELNNQFYKIFENSDHEMFACVLYAIIDTTKKKMYYSNSGQSLPVYVSSKTGEAVELDISGLPIGLMPNTYYDRKEITYNQNDLFFFHTDGLSDAFYKDNPSIFWDRLKEILSDIKPTDDPKEVLDIVLASFYNYNASDKEKLGLDDVSVILCKMG